MRKLLPNRIYSKPQIILTNLIDVILLIVFFFMITSSFSKHHKKMPINLPTASSGINIESETLAFQILNDGRIFYNKAETTLQEATKITQKYLNGDIFKPVIIEADKDVYYGKVIEFLDSLKSCGASNLGLTVSSFKQDSRISTKVQNSSQSKKN